MKIGKTMILTKEWQFRQPVLSSLVRGFSVVRDWRAELNPPLRPEHVIGAENRAERAENRVEWSGAWGGAWSGRDRKRWSGSGARSGNEVGNGLNRPLTALSITFHSTWLHTILYSPHWTVCSLLFQFSLFYSSCTCLVTCSNPVQAFTYNPAQGILNKIQSISSTWRVLAKCVYFER